MFLESGTFSALAKQVEFVEPPVLRWKPRPTMQVTAVFVLESSLLRCVFDVGKFKWQLRTLFGMK